MLYFFLNGTFQILRVFSFATEEAISRKYGIILNGEDENGRKKKKVLGEFL